MRTLQYHNFSIKGDPRWAATSRITGYAPMVVFALLVLSIIQVSLGAAWLSALRSVSAASIIQTLLVPGLAFFNAPTSLHLHLLVRRNPPLLALTFSTIFTTLWLASTLCMLIPCTLPAARTPLAVRELECPQGTHGVRKGVSRYVWGLALALGFVSAALYACHAAMAWWVWRAVGEKGEEVPVPIESDSAEAQRAREKWTRLTRLGYL